MAPTDHYIEPDLQRPLVRGRPEELLAILVHELLEAHEDTLSLAAELAYDPHWQAHSSYLRGLQLVARSILAETSDPSRL